VIEYIAIDLRHLNCDCAHFELGAAETFGRERKLPRDAARDKRIDQLQNASGHCGVRLLVKLVEKLQVLI
jgi:hypothetical protein